MKATQASYVDASALMKLVITEAESAVLRLALQDHAIVSSALGATEVRRAVGRIGWDEATARAGRLLDSIELLAVSDEVLDLAAQLEPSRLRTLDSIHVATAAVLGEKVGQLVTYDRRMVEAATLAGIAISSPA